MRLTLTSSPLFLGISCSRHVPVCFLGPVFYPSSLRFFCRLSRFLSRVVLSSFLEGSSCLGLMSSVLPWVLWTLLLALGRFVLPSLPGPLAVQLRFFLCMWFRQNLGVSSLRRSIWWSAGCSVPGTFYWCCGILSHPYRSLWALGRGFLFCLSSACGFLFTAFSRQLAAIGVLFVVFYWLLPDRFGSVLQFLAAFFFFSCECMLGAWWCYPFGPLASSHSPFAALLLLFKYLCLLLVSLFAFPNGCGVAFFSGT